MNDETEYHKKIKKLNLPEIYNDMPKEYIDTLYKYHIERKSLIIDESRGKKIKIVMKLLNKILKISNKEPIDDFKKFEITREEITNIKCQEYFESKYEDIFRLFSKKQHQFYLRKQKDNYILSFLRSAMRELGYDFLSKQIVLKKKVEGITMTRPVMKYYIE